MCSDGTDTKTRTYHLAHLHLPTILHTSLTAIPKYSGYQHFIALPTYHPSKNTWVCVHQLYSNNAGAEFGYIQAAVYPLLCLVWNPKHSTEQTPELTTEFKISGLSIAYQHLT